MAHLRKIVLVRAVLIGSIVILALLSFTRVATAIDWYNADWLYRKTITIDHTKVQGSDQADFPILITISDPDLQTHARSDGYDLVFTDSTGIVKIPYERESYTASSGALVAWVKVSSLSHVTDTVLYLYYGNAIASDQQDSSHEVWDTYFRGVWHLSDASPTTIVDSTSHGTVGTKQGSVGPVETTGKIGKAQEYNGTDDSINLVPSGALTGSFTVSVWAKVLDTEDRTILGTRNDGDNSFDFKFSMGETIHGDIGDGVNWITTEADASLSYSTDVWYFLTYVVKPDGYAIYVDGSEQASVAYGTSAPLLFDSSHNVFIGQVGYGEEWFYGAIDEVHISDVVRSADWIQTEYANQNNPSVFYAIGPQEVLTASPTPTPVSPTPTPTPSSSPTPTPSTSPTPTPSTSASSSPRSSSPASVTRITPVRGRALPPSPLPPTPVPLFDVVASPVLPQTKQSILAPIIVGVLLVGVLAGEQFFTLWWRRRK